MRFVQHNIHLLILAALGLAMIVELWVAFEAMREMSSAGYEYSISSTASLSDLLYLGGLLLFTGIYWMLSHQGYLADKYVSTLHLGVILWLLLFGVYRYPFLPNISWLLFFVNTVLTIKRGKIKKSSFEETNDQILDDL